MNIRARVASIIFGLLASCLLADDFYPLPSTNTIVLNFDSEIPQVVRGRIREDFYRCLIPSVSEINLYHFDHDPPNRLSLAGFWQPFSGFAATSRLGPDLPEYGILSNGVFTIDVSYTFATNYQRHIESTAAYSNEIAAAYAFIELLTPTNLQMMSTNELQSLDLWKNVPPGQFPASENIGKSVSFCRNRRVLAPPRVAFHVWECGPTNNPPYLWCTVPGFIGAGQTSANLMIYFQNRWWFSAWPFLNGEQQW